MVLIKCTDLGCSHNDGESCTNEIMLEKNKNSVYVSITDCNENDSDEVTDDYESGWYEDDYGWYSNHFDDEEEEEE